MTENPVAIYCERFAKSGMTPEEFARKFCIRNPKEALLILEEIGSFPSSEPELRALQKVWR